MRPPVMGRLVLFLLLIVALTGCASSGEVKPNIWLSLTPAQRAEADVLERAMARIKQDCARRHGDACQSPPVTVAFDGALPYYQQGTFVVPRAALEIMSSQAQTGEEFRAYASLYREALSSNSPAYQLLCLFKILEAIDYRRQTNKQSVARTNPELIRSSERLPKEDSECEPWLRRIYAVRPVWDPMEFGILFPAEVRGQKFTRVFQERLGPARKAIAHALSEKGEIHLSADLLLHNRTVDLWLPLTKLMARRMLKNEFPQEFLVGLGEG